MCCRCSRGPQVLAALTATIGVLAACGGDSAGPAPPPPPPPPTVPVDLLTVEKISVESIGETVEVPVNPAASWVFEVRETRWLTEAAVGRATRTDAGVRVEVLAAGDLYVDVWVPGSGGRETAVVEVRPTGPVVNGLRQDGWPNHDDVSVRAYAADQLDMSQIVFGGGPVEKISADSAQLVVRMPPLNDGACTGSPVAESPFAVSGSPRFDGTVMRLAGPVAALEVGETQRLPDGREACLRVYGEAGARYALAGVERAYSDATRDGAEVVGYGAHGSYGFRFQDRTLASAADADARPDPGIPFEEPIHADWPPSSGQEQPRYGLPMRYEGTEIPGLAESGADGLAVGDEFMWNTIDGRRGLFEVVALYDPNIVFSVYKADMSAMWSRSRAREIDEIFDRLGSPEVQDLYKATFGPEPARTNPSTGQMLVLFHDYRGGPTGVTTHNFGGDRHNSIVKVRIHPDWDSSAWYHVLFAHELAHAWQFRNLGLFTAIWSVEGIATWVADEELRLDVNESLMANGPVTRRRRDYPLELPTTGDFNYGYDESQEFLRYLVTRLMVEHGETYEAAANRVVVGVAEGWYGHHHLIWGRWNETATGPGLVTRMREIIPDWDPVEARLDWVLSFPADDRGNFGHYRIPYVFEAWRRYRPWQTINLGLRQSRSAEFRQGGNFYILVNDRDGVGSSVSLEVTSGEAVVAWKLIRYR